MLELSLCLPLSLSCYLPLTASHTTFPSPHVQKSDGRGIYSLSLAEMEAERRNNSVCLTVDLDFNMTTTSISTSSNAIIAAAALKGDGSGGSTSDVSGVRYIQSTPPDSDNIVVTDKGKKGDGDGVAADAHEHEVFCGNSLQLDISRDCSLLFLKIKVLWGLNKFKPFIGDREIGHSVTTDVSPTADINIGTSSRSSSSICVTDENSSDRRTDEANRIFNLIDTTRLRLGDCRGELKREKENQERGRRRLMRSRMR